MPWIFYPPPQPMQGWTQPLEDQREIPTVLHADPPVVPPGTGLGAFMASARRPHRRGA